MTHDLVVGKIKISTLLAFIFGATFLLITLVVRLTFPVSSGAEIAVQVPTALAAAAITAGIPGLFRFTASSPGKALTIRATGSLLVFLIVLAMHSSPAQTIALIEGALIFFTPLVIRHGLRKYRIRIGKPSLVLLSTLMVLGEAAFFSETAGARLPDLPSDHQVYHRDDFVGYDLVGSRDSLSNLWVQDDARFARGAVDPTDGRQRLEMTLKVEWRRSVEWIPILRRNYGGRVYYTVDYRCDADQIATYPSRLKGYSLRPGRNVPSWLLGFAEIPFLLNDRMANGKIERLVQERLRPCP